MGSEDLFKKRKARHNAEFKRTSKARSQMKKILIICEGEKTEPTYFADFVKHCRISTASIIEITGECGSSPLSVLTSAKEKYAAEKKKGDPYDKVYCVFDRDAHPGYQSALTQIQEMNPKGVFEAITSVPCFEYWLVLHFGCCRKAFSPKGSKSEGAQMLSELKKFMPDYEKKAFGVFNRLQDRLHKAIDNCRTVEKASIQDGSTNPTTKVGSLVTDLMKVRDDFEKAK